VFDAHVSEGGIGYYSSSYGLGFDQVIAFELVTPTGDIKNVTAQTYPDLMFALRVCTSFR
jgi:FAD/FMN-containing dehydrogenase